MPKLTTAAGLLLLATALLATACGDDDDEASSGGNPTTDSSTQAFEIVAADFAFEPAQVSVEPGRAIVVTLKNSDGVEHSFTIDELAVDAEAGGDQEAQAEFTTPEDSVEFYCRYHPDRMRGTLNVTGDAGGAALPTREGSTDGGYIGY